MLTISGSGFGLYGYLPAVLESNYDTVVLCEKFKSKILARQELNKYYSQIKWVNTDFEAYKHSDTLILSLPPEQQYLLIKKVLNTDDFKFKKIFLEKPLSVNSIYAGDLLSLLKKSGVRFRIAYTFMFCEWYNSLINYFDNCRNANVHLIWKFNAFHINNNISSWKADSDKGGGVLNFYGIHIIAVLAALKFFRIDSSNLVGPSNNNLTKWNAVFSDGNANKILVEVDTNSLDIQFSIEDKSSNDGYSLNMESPFSNEYKLESQDIRINSLVQYLKTMDDNKDPYMFYDEVNILWSKVSSLSKIKIE